MKLQLEKAGIGGMKKPPMPKNMAGMKTKKVSTIPQGAIPWGNQPVPAGRSTVKGPQGGTYLLPGGTKGTAQPLPQAGAPGQPQQLPQQQTQQLPNQQPQQVPQELTEEKVKELYPKLPRPDLVKFTLPEGVNWYGMKEIYTELLDIKKNLRKFRDEMEEKYPGKFDEFNSRANQLLQAFDDKLGVENILSVGKPTKIKPYTELDRKAKEVRQAGIEQRYGKLQETKAESNRMQQAEASLKVEERDVSKLKTPIFKLTSNTSKSIHTDMQAKTVKEDFNKLNSALNKFGFKTKFRKIPSVGVSATRYETTIDKNDIYGKKIGRIQGVFGTRDLSAVLGKKANVSIDGNKLYIDIANQKPTMVDFNTQYKKLKPTNIQSGVLPIGQSLTGKDLNVNFDNRTHWLVTGSTGSGKSVMINNIIGSLAMRSPKDVQLMLIDPKGGIEFKPWENLPHNITKVGTTPEQGLAMMKKAKDIMTERQNLIAKSGLKNINEYNKKFPNNKIPNTYIVVDEFKEMMDLSGDKQFLHNIQGLAQLGRSAGIHLVLGTQHGSAQTLSNNLLTNLPNRIMFGMPEDVIANNKMMTRMGVGKLKNPGSFVSNIDDKTIRGQASYMSNDNVNEITNSWGTNTAPTKHTAVKSPKQKNTKVPKQKG